MTLDKAITEGYTITEKEAERVIKELKDDYAILLRESKTKLDSLYLRNLTGVSPDDYANVLRQRRKLESFIRSIQKLYDQVQSEQATKLIQANKIAVSNNFYRQEYLVNFANRADYPFSLIPQTAVNISVIGTPDVWENIKSKTLRGLEEEFKISNMAARHGTLIDTLQKNKREALVQIRQTITNSLTAGKSVRQAAQDIKKILNTTLSKAQRIARTELHRNLNAGHYAAVIDAQNEGIDIKRIVLATLDKRTRPQSAQIDGQTENDEGFFTYPGGVSVAFPGNSGVARWDINDRETTIETVNNEGPKQRRGRDPVTGKNEVFGFTTFNEWAKSKGLKKNKFGQIVGGG